MSEVIIPNPNLLETAIPGVIEGWLYSCQWDPQWKDLPYSITGAPEQTMALAGCVPTLQDVVLRNLCGAVTTPPDLAAWNILNGMRTEANGTLRASWNLLVQQAPLEQEILGTDRGSIEAAMALGGLIIASVKTPHRDGLGTPSGHVIGIRGFDNGEVRVIDVNSPANSQRVWAADDILPFVTSSLRHVRSEGSIRPVRLRKANSVQRLRAKLSTKS